MYDPEYIARYYDEYGEREWDRLDTTPAGRVNFHIHRSYLARYVEPGDHVLDIGAGPGRFTIELVRLGARVTAADISPGQLELHRDKVLEAGCEYGIQSRQILDVVDLSCFADGHFDAVVCYGGPLSYVFDRFDDALQELVRVTRPGGYVLFSVMSLVGSVHQYLAYFSELLQQFGVDEVQQILDSGDLTGNIAGAHQCRMYRWAQVSKRIQSCPCSLEAASASNFLILGNEEGVEASFNDPDMWHRFLEWEYDACRQPGAIDGGTHIIVVLRKISLASEHEPPLPVSGEGLE